MVTEHCMWTPSKTNVADGTWSGSLQSPCPPRDLQKGSLHAGAADDLQKCEGTGSQGHDLFVLAPCVREMSLSTCAGTGIPTHTTHLPSRQKGACDSVTRCPAALDNLQLHLFQPSSKYVPSVPSGGTQGSDICKEVQDLTAKPSLSLRGRRERHGPLASTL